jgi:hypothetical protein
MYDMQRLKSGSDSLNIAAQRDEALTFVVTDKLALPENP